jgi:hypothetical protein
MFDVSEGEVTHSSTVKGIRGLRNKILSYMLPQKHGWECGILWTCPAPAARWFLAPLSFHPEDGDTSLRNGAISQKMATPIITEGVTLFITHFVEGTQDKVGLCRPSLWSSGQSSWLQIRRPGFDSRYYQKKKVVGLERGPLSLVSTTEELLDSKVAAPV